MSKHDGRTGYIEGTWIGTRIFHCGSRVRDHESASDEHHSRVLVSLLTRLASHFPRHCHCDDSWVALPPTHFAKEQILHPVINEMISMLCICHFVVHEWHWCSGRTESCQNRSATRVPECDCDVSLDQEVLGGLARCIATAADDLACARNSFPDLVVNLVRVGFPFI